MHVFIFHTHTHTHTGTQSIHPVNSQRMGLEDIARPDTTLESVTGKAEVLDDQLVRKTTVIPLIEPFVQCTMTCACVFITCYEV